MQLHEKGWDLSRGGSRARGCRAAAWGPGLQAVCSRTAGGRRRSSRACCRPCTQTDPSTAPSPAFRPGKACVCMRACMCALKVDAALGVRIQHGSVHFRAYFDMNARRMHMASHLDAKLVLAIFLEFRLHRLISNQSIHVRTHAQAAANASVRVWCARERETCRAVKYFLLSPSVGRTCCRQVTL
jgi:hypothetical protein